MRPFQCIVKDRIYCLRERARILKVCTYRHSYMLLKETCLSIKFIILYFRKVSFDVQLKNHVNNLAPKERVIFTTVDLNEGKGYNPSTGIFIAPAPGMYVFDWTILTQRGKIAHISLVVNGKFKTWNHCDDGLSKTWLSCSKMSIAKLKQGDKVWIGVFSSPAYMYNQYTTFSGYEL